MTGIQFNVEQAFWNALLTVLQNFTTWVTDQIDGGGMVIMQGVISLIRSAPFITNTDVALVNSLSTLFGWAQVMPLVDAVLRASLLLAAAAHAGHHYFGWRAMPESIQRWGVALILTRLSWQIQDWSLQVMSSMTHAVSVAIPDFPNINGVNPLVLIVLMAIWAVLLFRLVLLSAERIAWLVVLKPIGPLAFVTWAIPQTSWIASQYIKIWSGWLIGQFLVILAIAAMEVMINRGGIEGYFLSCACLLVAQKAITMLVPTASSGGFIKVGPIKV